MNIYVGNVPYSLTESELRGAFEEFGHVVSVTILRGLCASLSSRLANFRSGYFSALILTSIADSAY